MPAGVAHRTFVVWGQPMADEAGSADDGPIVRVNARSAMRDARCAMRDARCAMHDAGCAGRETAPRRRSFPRPFADYRTPELPNLRATSSRPLRDPVPFLILELSAHEHDQVD